MDAPFHVSADGQTAGAIISAFGESAQEKVELLAELGVAIAPNPSLMGETVARMLEHRATGWQRHAGLRPHQA